MSSFSKNIWTRYSRIRFVGHSCGTNPCAPALLWDSLAAFGEVQIMLSEKELRTFLISAFEHLGEQRFALSSVLAEVAAVRDALIEIGRF